MRLALGFLVAGISCSSAAEEMTSEFTVRPIGWVRKAQQKTSIVVDKEFQPGLLGLEGFSHVYVFYWFNRNDNPKKRSILRVHPRGNPQNPLTGVFATRSPARPNLIALSLCRIIGIQKNIIEINSIDALPDSPVLDLKPFIPHSDIENAVVPHWLEDETRKHEEML